MKKLILLGLVILLTIFSVSAIEEYPITDGCYWMDMTGDCYLGGDDLPQVEELNSNVAYDKTNQYVSSFSPLRYNGEDYSTAAIYYNNNLMVAGGSGVFTSDNTIVSNGVYGSVVNGNNNFAVWLVNYPNSDMKFTVYVENPTTRTCSDIYRGAEYCAFVQNDYWVSNGAGNDYTLNQDPSVSVVPGYSQPSLKVSQIDMSSNELEFDSNYDGVIDMTCPITIWDLNGDGVVSTDDNILDIAQEISSTGIYNGIIKGSPRKLTFDYINNEFIAKVTTDSAVTGFPEVGRACIGVNIDGTQYFSDENGEVRVPMTLNCGETHTATIQGDENKQIPDMKSSYYSGDCPVTSNSGGSNSNFRKKNSPVITPAVVITPVVKPTPVVTPMAPVVEETPSVVTPTGSVILNGITSNPGIAAGIAILALGMITGTVFYFKRNPFSA